ncbi:P-loop containing nucleoside triphosphate hydrolase protein, partial [Pelagophyceae sp. CCMP2097]
DFFEAVCRPLVDEAAAGRRATLIAYGATGSGKTHSARHATRKAAELMLASGPLTVSFFENAGEHCYDLLSDRQEVKLLTDGDGEVVVQGLETVTVADVADFDARLASANALRATAATERNAQSSRSHAICELRPTGAGAAGRLRFVDLAGSERLQGGAAGHSPQRLKEAREINTSLACVNECLRARLLKALRHADAPAHVPYRRAKLTMLLRECFDDEAAGAVLAETVLVGHVSPSATTANESKRTL